MRSVGLGEGFSACAVSVGKIQLKVTSNQIKHFCNLAESSSQRLTAS